MSQPGRKRKAFHAPTLPTTQDALNRLNAVQARKAKIVVLAQPHRRATRDPEHPWAESALGRLCLRYHLHPQLFEGGQEYSSLIHRWRASKGIPGQGPIGEGQTGDYVPSAATVKAWEACIARIEGALARHQRGLTVKMRILLLDGLDLPVEAESDAVEGLQVIGMEIGVWAPPRPELVASS